MLSFLHVHWAPPYAQREISMEHPRVAWTHASTRIALSLTMPNSSLRQDDRIVPGLGGEAVGEPPMSWRSASPARKEAARSVRSKLS
ncbi:hypothetical protein C8R44DRAFT_47340 [Mycena epipterygia]|nr:hypothetical protein C8R44DRAFT_47340 [Mycena epipterygia]